MKRRSGNFYSHKCRLGVCPDLFFLLFSLAPFTRTPTNADQTVLRQERITFKRPVKKKGEKKTVLLLQDESDLQAFTNVTPGGGKGGQRSKAEMMEGNQDNDSMEVPATRTVQYSLLRVSCKM